MQTLLYYWNINFYYLTTVPWRFTALYLAIALLPPFLYLDATHRRVGKNPGVGYGIHAGTWAMIAAAPIIGIFFSFAYLAGRPELVHQARLFPAHAVPGSRRASTFLLVLAASVASQLLIIEEANCPHRGSPMFLQLDDVGSGE
jgi:hypothetical protein